MPKKFFLAGAAFLAGAFFAAAFLTGAFFFATGAFDLGGALPGGTWMPVTGPLKNMFTSDERTADRATPDTGALKAELRTTRERG
mgnify:CR=1 FL=1